MKTLAKWSIDEYHSMIKSGILDNRNVELLAGEIVEMSPETPLHYSIAKRGSKYLSELLLNKADIRFNGPITLLNSEPEPDITIVKLPESNYYQRHPDAEDIFLLVEVAKTSFKKDLELKASIYAEANILEYWILDLSTQQIVVLRSPENAHYTVQKYYKDGVIIPLAFPDIQVLVNRILQF